VSAAYSHFAAAPGERLPAHAVGNPSETPRKGFRPRLSKINALAALSETSETSPANPYSQIHCYAVIRLSRISEQNGLVRFPRFPTGLPKWLILRASRREPRTEVSGRGFRKKAPPPSARQRADVEPWEGTVAFYNSERELKRNTRRR
jgi:hypothetical protein